MLKPVLRSKKLLFLQVNDLLDRSLISNQLFHVNVEEFDIRHALQEVIEIEEQSAEEHENTFSVKFERNMPKLVISDLNRF